MIYFPDINVWIASISDRHVHHQSAKLWFQTTAGDRVAFCRITEMGFLRLLTNKHVMKEDARHPSNAWILYDTLRQDSRVIFIDESKDVGTVWRQKTEQSLGGPNIWTDAYLAAFAAVHKLTLVTFDQKLGNRSGGLLLTPDAG